jgi:predicted nucleic-acid-binding Zn-ribbon protein
MTTCPKCRSTDIIDEARIIDHGDHHSRRDLAATVFKKPGAFIFKGAVSRPLTARVCASCGFVEFYVSDPKALHQAARERED